MQPVILESRIEKDDKTVPMVQMIERHLMITVVGLGRGERNFKRYFRG